LVYPAHGAGSACGKKIQSGTVCTIGNQKKTNYALQELTKEDFVDQLTKGITKPPTYFFHDVNLNRNGPRVVEDVLKGSLHPLKLEDVKKKVADGAFILDTRVFDEVKGKGRIPGSINVSLVGNYAINVATLLRPTDKIILVVPEGKEKEAVVRLSRVGYDTVIGYLEGGFDSWIAGGETTEQWDHVTPEDFSKKITENPHVLDVRNRPELESDGAVEGSQNIPMSELHARISEVPKDKPVWVHCKAGVRSYMAGSLLRHYGITTIDVKGGIDAIKIAGYQAKPRVSI